MDERELDRVKECPATVTSSSPSLLKNSKNDNGEMCQDQQDDSSKDIISALNVEVDTKGEWSISLLFLGILYE